MKKLTQVVALLTTVACLLTGCGDLLSSDEEMYTSTNSYTKEEALVELKAKADTVEPREEKPRMALYDPSKEVVLLDDLDKTYPLPVEGNGQINIEIAAATELSSDAPDDLMCVWATNFNKAGYVVNGRSVGVSVRQITSGEIVTYTKDGDYRPDAACFSFDAWGKMLDASGFEMIKLTDRLVGNTAGVLMKKEVYDKYIEKYHEVTMDKVILASIAGDLNLATTNPYKSSATLNSTSTALCCFDPADPLSTEASNQLLEYQKTDPHMADTTAAMSYWMENGVVDAAIMEEQAYCNSPSLKNFVYTPIGVRHDHPVYTFGYVSPEKREAVQKFVDYCLSDEAQKIADEKGFNRHDDYQPADPGLSGADYYAVQKIWKKNRDGGQPTIMVVLVDTSGSMRTGAALSRVQESLKSACSYIDEDCYVGLISYASDVCIHLPIKQFNVEQKACFINAVERMTPYGGTAIYDGLMVALQKMYEKAEEVPDAQLKLVILSDGERERGFKFREVIDVVDGLDVIIYPIAYNLDLTDANARKELERLTGVSETTLIDASTDNVANQLRDLFMIKF